MKTLAATRLTTLALVGAFSVAGADARADNGAKKIGTDDSSTQTIDVANLKAVVERLARENAAMAERLRKLETPAPRAPVTVSSIPFLERKPGDSLTFLTPNGEITLYGYLDVSLDGSTKGISDLTASDGSGPVGNLGWMPDVSTNMSYVGVKGFQRLGKLPLKFVYQLETQIDIAAVSGPGNSNSQSDTAVKGGLTSRNTFLGITTPYGTLKVGKTDAPYKTSTARMNPFLGMWGDYSVIMGNTGGDNRVEFGTRLDHSIWYESPNLGGFRFAALFSPGQNRGDDSAQLAMGETDCTGGNVPGSGGTVPVGCTDGGWDNAVSASASFERAGFYWTAAYERHFRVNRTSDLATLDANGVLAGYDANDIADEDAMKMGVQYAAPWGTTVSAAVERLRRYLPDYLQAQNERSRIGWWFALSQTFFKSESVHVGWAHAEPTPGDPGQHNSEAMANPPNAADMFTVAYKHKLDNGITVYADYAITMNKPSAHFDLGAGGRAVTTDCHDASMPALGDTTGEPHCWAGGQVQGFSIGLSYAF